MKKSILIVITILLCFIISSCSDGSKGEYQPIAKYAAEFRGEWIRMDNGNLWYIKGNKILVNGSASDLNVTLTRKSDNVITATGANNQKYTLFAKRVANASIKAQVVFPDENDSSQNIVSRSSQGSTGRKPPVIITNPSQPDLPPVTVDPDQDTGEITVSDQIPGDRIEVVPDDSEWDDIKVGITPGYGEDQNMGSIPLIKGFNFKVSIKMTDTNENIYELYADNIARNYIIEVENIGTEESKGASYSITFDDNDFELNAGALIGSLGTIVPGAKKNDIMLTLRSKQIEEESKVKEIKVQIKYVDESASVIRTWDDTVSINYFRQSVPFFIRSEYSVQGVIKSPRGETYYFKTVKSRSDYSFTANVPWSGEDYIIAFLGATVDSESVYSIGIGEMPSTDWESFKKSGEQYKYYPACNDEKTAPKLDLTNNKTFMYYLYDDAEQYFRINLGTTPPNPYIVDFDLNGGVGIIPDSFNVNAGANIILPYGDELRNGNLIFSGWNTQANGSGTNYRAGFPYKPNGDIILYAIWGENKHISFDVKNVTEWNYALTGIKNGGEGTAYIRKTYTIMISGNFSVQGNASTTSDIFSFGSNYYIDVTIAGNGTITLNSKGSILIFSTEQKLIIDGENLTLKGLTDNDYPVIYIVNGTLELLNGTISGNTNNSQSGGGGIRVMYPEGKFIMSGGTIKNNTACFGGGVFIAEDAIFEMKGGTINDNYVFYDGGGIYIFYGNFDMSGGLINGNEAEINGGGVRFEYSSGKGIFRKLGGGIIRGNDTHIDSNTTANYAVGGGHAYYCNNSSNSKKDYRDLTLKMDDNIEIK